MTKETDVNDLLGNDTPVTEKPAKAKKDAPKAPAKKADKAAPAKKADKAPAEKPAKAEKAPKADKAEPKVAKERAKKDPITFAEGEREAIIKRIPKLLKNPINSKTLAEKLEIETRKLRAVLYAMERAGVIALERGASRTSGMTVSSAV
ncbi:MAG: hypothetical protein JZU64_00555 [Rhodoferax sp.]|nr:hypothetical protein [Rhodoferax sp.]